MTPKRAGTRNRKRGQSMVEFALIAPTFFLMVFGIVEFGLLMFNVASSRFAAGEAARIESYVGNTEQDCSAVKGCANLGGTQWVQPGPTHVGKCDADCQALVAINNSPVGTTSLEKVLWVEIRQCPNAACPNSPGSGLGTYNIRTAGDTCLSTDLGHCNTYPATGRSTSANLPEYLQVTLHYQYDWKTGLLKAIHNAPVILDASYLVRIEPQKF